MAIDLQELGITSEELIERVIERTSDRLLSEHVTYDDGGQERSALAQKLETHIARQIETAMTKFADTHIRPRVEEIIASATFTETNRFGEAKGKTFTLLEYLIDRADKFLTEKVDFQGKSKGEDPYHNFNGTQTRLTHLIHQHFHYHIESTMKAIVASASERIQGGLQGAVEGKLKEILADIKVEVKTKK